MKTLLTFFLLSAACACAQVETLNFGARGKLVIYLPGEWKSTTTDMAGQYTLTISPKKESTNASCTITVTFPDVDRYDTRMRLKLRVEADSYSAAEGSVEGKAIAKEFLLRSGYGFYCSFTDPELRGKPSQPGNYKVMSTGKIRLSPEVLIDVTMLADGFKEEPYQQLLGAIEGMEFTPGRGR
ncbi:hypothetical protein [Horticoccus sp. 23ND18S-11]|uniref:hypothetical protein n=1 Tax=Horticoccus sp. 23ND18S-11 TaxID=3391832 RepID=UPI0039C9C4D9